MKTHATMLPTQPKAEGRTPCEPGSPQFAKTVGVLESVRQNIALLDGDESTDKQNAAIAPIFDKAVGAYGKADALAEELGITKSYLSEMRSGKKPIALRHLIPLLKSREAIAALVAPLCMAVDLQPPQPAKKLSRAQLKDDALALLVENDALLRMFIDEVARRRGVQRDDVLRVLAEDEK
jgi:transcriptional regulator with XRE-family HTH domain